MSVLLSLLNRGRLQMVGPVFAFDLVRAARRPSLFAHRFLFGAGLLGVLLLLYRVWSAQFRGGAVPAGEMSAFVELVFLAFMAVQFYTAGVITAVSLAGLFADERERRVLELLFTTDLRGREILFDKAAARLTGLGSVILTGLPFWCLLELLGGVNLGMVLAGYALTALTMCSLAALSVLVAIHSRGPANAQTRVFLLIGAYTLFTAWTSGHMRIPFVPPYVEFADVTDLALTRGPDPVTVDDVVQAFAAGNPFLVLIQIGNAITSGQSIAAVLQEWLGTYVGFHVILLLACAALSIVRFRAVLLRQLFAVVPAGAAARAAHFRPAVGRWPMVWKEMYVQPPSGRPPGGRVDRWLSVAITLFVFLVPVVILLNSLMQGPWHLDGREVNRWLGGLVAFLAAISLMQVPSHAALTLAAERDRQTLEGLLMTPLPTRAILFGKWLGSLLCARWLWVWLLFVWAEGLVLAGLRWQALLLLPPVWLVYASVLAVAGLWFAVRSPTSQQANQRTAFALMGLFLCPWLLWSVHLPFLLLLDAPDRAAAWLFRLSLGLSPPTVVTVLARCGDPEANVFGMPLRAVAPFILTGLALWSVGGVIWWRSLVVQFRAANGRDVVRPSRGKLETHSVTAGPPTAKLRRRGVVLTLAVGGGLAAAYVYLSTAAGRDLRDAVDQLDANDPGWRLEDIERSRALAPGNGNAAEQVLAVVPLLRASWPMPPDSRDLRRTLFRLPPDVQFDGFQTAQLEKELARAMPALVQARTLAEMPRGRYPIPRQLDQLDPALEPLQIVTCVAWRLWLDVVARLQRGDTAEACASLRAMLNTGRSIGDEPFLQLLPHRLAVQQLAVFGLERLLAQGEPTMADLAALQTLLEGEARQSLLATGLRGDRAVCHWALEQVESGAARFAPVVFTVRRQVTIGLERFAGQAAYERSHAWLLRFQTDAVAAAGRPLSEQAAAFAALRERSRSAPWLAQYFVTEIPEVANDFLRCQARLRCAIVAVAAERYRQTRGRWPAEIGAMVPEFLPEVPSDPYDGAALRWRQEDGPVIYSIGPDGRDDGGRLDRQDLNRPGTDLGVQLWDASRRRRPPRNPDVGPPVASPLNPAGHTPTEELLKCWLSF